MNKFFYIVLAAVSVVGGVAALFSHYWPAGVLLLAGGAGLAYELAKSKAQRDSDLEVASNALEAAEVKAQADLKAVEANVDAAIARGHSVID